MRTHAETIGRTGGYASGRGPSQAAAALWEEALHAVLAFCWYLFIKGRGAFILYPFDICSTPLSDRALSLIVQSLITLYASTPYSPASTLQITMQHMQLIQSELDKTVSHLQRLRESLWQFIEMNRSMQWELTNAGLHERAQTKKYMYVEMEVEGG